MRRNTLLVVIITSFLTTFNSSSLNLSIPSISAEFNVSAQSIGWLVTIYTLCNVAFSIPFGKIADITSRVKIFRTGIVVFTIGTFISAFSGSYTLLLITRFLQGFGASMIFATSNAILIDAYEPSEKGKVLGYSVCFTYVGLSAGPFLGGLINGYFCWRWVMILSATVSLSALILAFFKLPVEKTNQQKHFFDFKGASLYSIGLAALMYGLSALGSALSLALIIGGSIVLVLFIIRERNCENNCTEAIIKLSLFKNKNFSYSNLAAMMNYAATYAVSYFMSIYLQLVRGYSSQIAGVILIATPIFQALLSPIAGRLSDKYSPFKLSSAGMSCCAISLASLIFIGETTPIYLIIPILAFLGLGFALFSSPNTNAIMSEAGKEDAGIASSIIATVRNIGQTLSMAIISVAIGIFVGNTSINQASIQSIMNTMHCIFIVFSAVCAVGIFISLKRE